MIIKKISSLVLSTLLSITAILPSSIYAKGEKKPNPSNSESKNSSCGVKDFFTNFLYAGGLAAYAGALYKFIKPKEPKIVIEKQMIANLKDNPNACAAPIPLRAIAWHDNLCWFNSSLLLYYHTPVYNDIISNFPIKDAEQLIANGRLDSEQRINLETIVCLSKIFKALHADQTNPNYKLPQVISLNDYHVQDLINKLRDFSKSQGLYIDDEILNYGAPCNICSLIIYNLIKSTAKANLNSPAPLSEWSRQASECCKNFPINESGLDIANNDLNISIKHSYGHFWVELRQGNETFEIGRSITSEYAISVKSEPQAPKTDADTIVISESETEDDAKAGKDEEAPKSETSRGKKVEQNQEEKNPEKENPSSEQAPKTDADAIVISESETENDAKAGKSEKTPKSETSRGRKAATKTKKSQSQRTTKGRKSRKRTYKR